MNWSFTLKKLISRVRPGVRLTRANAFRRTSRLSSDDLPDVRAAGERNFGKAPVAGRHPPAVAMPPRNSSSRMTSGSRPGLRAISGRDAVLKSVPPERARRARRASRRSAALRSESPRSASASTSSIVFTGWKRTAARTSSGSSSSSRAFP